MMKITRSKIALIIVVCLAVGFVAGYTIGFSACLTHLFKLVNQYVDLGDLANSFLNDIRLGYQ